MSTATPPEVQGEIITPPEDRLSLCAAALRQSALRRADSHCCPPWPIRKAGLRCTLIRISTRFPDRNIFERLMRLSFSGFLREHSKSIARSEPDQTMPTPGPGRPIGCITQTEEAQSETQATTLIQLCHFCLTKTKDNTCRMINIRFDTK